MKQVILINYGGLCSWIKYSQGSQMNKDLIVRSFLASKIDHLNVYRF